MTPNADETGHFLAGCLSLDIEVGRKNERIHAFAAVRPDTGQAEIFQGGDLPAALAKLDDFADGTTFLLGHNLIAFDLPHLHAAKPDLRLLRLPAVDTLRLNPLAFPRNPYHHLVKHYQDGQLKRGRVNNPKLDAELALEVFRNQQHELRQNANAELLLAWHWLATAANDSPGQGFDAFFSALRESPRPSDEQACKAIRGMLKGKACLIHGQEIIVDPDRRGWALAYALAWLSVSGGNSVMPPWVRHQFPEAGRLVRLLRDTPCDHSDCHWCEERHDARQELKRWFGFDDFRPAPKDSAGQPMQRSIVEAAMAGQHVLGILPTGTGKSLCYQIPALSRYDKTGALTVVISPLVALMADQVAGLEKRSIDSCVTINSLLSMPERAAALDKVRLGDAGILVISPEQLRSISVRKALAQREIGAWVLDEAHCLSRWGHDFRPDYRYIGRFIRERMEKTGQTERSKPRPPPVLCLTATAKPDVAADIQAHFRGTLDIELMVFDGGANRTNLGFVVVSTAGGEKFAHIHQILTADLPPGAAGGAIVYCATRKQAEDIAGFLQSKEVAADHFHAKLSPETRKDVQQRFVEGELRVIAATNAFGMGIDKPDVRLVIHADIPGSLENYFQEAGRAGRDRNQARCILLYDPEDAERQFGMSARSRLTRREIHGILRALRNLDRRKRANGEVVATPGEILVKDEDQAFERDSATDDTRVRTAVAWLEEAKLLTRNENQVRIFPSSLRVGSVDAARAKLEQQAVPDDYRRQLLEIAERLIEADADEGISTDELMQSGLGPEGVRNALYDLEQLGIASNDTALTAFVHSGVRGASKTRFEEAASLERALVDQLRVEAPDLGKGDSSMLHLRMVAQRLRDDGHGDPLPPERLWRLLRSIAEDGRNEDGGRGSLSVRRRDPETVRVTLQREWDDLEKTAERRRSAAQVLLQHLLDSLPGASQGVDLLAETTLGKLLAALKSDLALKAAMKDPRKLLDRALLWLHEQEIIRLNKGLAVFRPAMTIRLEQGHRGFAGVDFKPLKLHYDEQVLQVHVMLEFAQRGLQAMAEALRLAMDYFSLKRDDFLRRWFPGRKNEIARQTTPEAWRVIVEDLKNPIQQRIVADDREQTNVLVLAGPGSGKTRVLVHRIAYLVRARRENPRGILVLAYNRHAAVDIRRRLTALIDHDARPVTVLTCHALAMRLIGASFAERSKKSEPDDETFRQMMRQAVDLLRGKGLPPEDVDEQRERLLAGFRWILVDEYQDIGPDEYDLISALAGRTRQDKDTKLNLFAVGDDDQNIYAFKGAAVRFIRRFEEDYQARPFYLTDNYRSTAHIIEAANALIEPTQQRMKAEHPIVIDRARKKAPFGGAWATLDPVSQGRVQILRVAEDPVRQANAAITELQRLANLLPDWNWSACAVIARKWEYLDPVRALCEHQGIPVQMGNEQAPGFWRLRETQALLGWLRQRETPLVSSADLNGWLRTRPAGAWMDLLREAVDEYANETGDDLETSVEYFIEWLAAWGREARRRQQGLLLSTAHRAKGLEFDHVVVLDGDWRAGGNEDADAPRRLYYVAMTRARQMLTLMRFEPAAGAARASRSRHLQDDLPVDSAGVLRRIPAEWPLAMPASALRLRYQRLTLRDVYLSFAGRRNPNHPVHRAIAALSPGDELQVREQRKASWELRDPTGELVGHLSRSFQPPSGMRCQSAKVFAIATWEREVSQPEYQDGLRCDQWEVVVPELVFEPCEILA